MQPAMVAFDRTRWIILFLSQKWLFLAFLISLVRVVLTRERERESEGKGKWAKEGIREDGREMGRKKGVMMGRSHFRSC